MKKYLKLLRVKHYIKNFLVFLPLIFSKNFLELDKLLITLLGTISFCLISSTVYIINDIKDVEKDRCHPIKKKRPIASGEISISKAIIIACILAIIAIMCIVIIYINYHINIFLALLYLLLYLILNIAYSFGLKDKPIIDIIILVSGFVLRVLFGGVIVDVEISGWLYLTIISISFYLGLGKRRNELIKHSTKDTRKVLEYYTKDFLDKNMYVCMSLAIAFYALWAMNYVNKLMIWTVPIVMILAMKYSFNIESKEAEGDPIEVILKDKMIVMLGVIYLIFTFAIIYY